MTPQELKKQAHKEFGERFKCIQGDCDGTGHIPEQVSEDEWTSYQCQFHAEYLLPTKSFLDSLIDKTVAYRDNQVRSRIANIFASKYENEPRVSEKIERAVMSCFNDEDFEPNSGAIPHHQQERY